MVDDSFILEGKEKIKSEILSEMKGLKKIMKAYWCTFILIFVFLLFAGIALLVYACQNRRGRYEKSKNKFHRVDPEEHLL